MAIIFKTNSTEKSFGIRFFVSVLALITIVLALLGTVLLTEAGQMLNVPRDWVFNFFHYRKHISIGLGFSLAILVVLQIIYGLVKRWLGVVFLMGVIGCLFMINSFVPDYWLRSQQHTAEYISIDLANELLKDEDDVFVLELNGEARAYPRDWMMLPHFAGDDFAGEHVTMSYCVLSNLPLAFNSVQDGKPTDYRVIAQVHNNLVFTDRNTGNLIQQITSTAERSQQKLEQYPVQRMPWHAFRSLYPTGKVFKNIEPTTLDKITDLMFKRELVKHYDGEPIFPTLDLKDSRLPNGEPVVGIELGGEQLAVASSFFEKKHIFNTQLGGQDIVLAWFPEYQTYGVFSRELDGNSLIINEIDPYGETPDGKLERLQTYPGLLWMIWSHWFPGTQLLK